LSALNQEELLSMIKFGADQIFSSKDSTITEEDIDAILSKGEEKTAVITEKLRENSKKILDFSNDGTNIWNFEGVDYSHPEQKKFNPLGFWIEPAKRERKTNNYAVDEYYRNALRVGAPKHRTGPQRPPKQPVIYDFQFFPARLHELFEKETAAWLARHDKSHGQTHTSRDVATPPPSNSGTSSPTPSPAVEEEKEKLKEKEKEKEQEKEQGQEKEKEKKENGKGKESKGEAKDNKTTKEAKEKEVKEEAQKELKEKEEEGKAGSESDEKDKDGEEDKETEEKKNGRRSRKGKGKAKEEEEEQRADDLTPEEQIEKEKLLKQGFHDWTRREFLGFIKGCEKYGRKLYAQIATEVPTKTQQQIKEYSNVFWNRYDEIQNYEKYIKQIEGGENRMQRLEDMKDHLDSKVKRYDNPWQQMKIVYGAGAKGKAFTEEEDIFLVCMMHQLGYGEWESLKEEIRKSWQFRFDYFLKSRTPAELMRRCDTLMRLIEKENQEIEEKERERAREAERRRKEAGRKKVTPTKKTITTKSGRKSTATSPSSSSSRSTTTTSTTTTTPTSIRKRRRQQDPESASKKPKTDED